MKSQTNCTRTRNKKSETDALEEQIFAQEDQLQKQVKGKKATSSDGNLIQKGNLIYRRQSKIKFIATGLFASSFLLAGIKPPKSKEKNNQNDDLYTEDKSQSTNVGDDAFGFGSF